MIPLDAQGGKKTAVDVETLVDTLKRRLTAMPRFRGFHEKAQGFKTWTSFLKSIDGVAIRRGSDLRIDVGLESPAGQ